MMEYKSIESHWREIDDELNKLAKDGWKVIGFSVGGSSGYQAFALLERAKK
jgi:pimeloyl-ACP methyl ester carboxylesterase